MIRNILATFNFPTEKLFQPNTGTLVKAPINIIPSDMVFYVTDDSFERLSSLSRWLYVELIGLKKRKIEQYTTFCTHSAQFTPCHGEEKSSITLF